MGQANVSSTVAAVVFDLLNPVSYGFFVGGLGFDVVYAQTADVMWVKCAAWLISVGLFVAVVPRLINLVQVWLPRAGQRRSHSKLAFFLYLVGIAAAIANAFVHSRDAYAVVPDGVWLFAVTVVFLVAANILMTLQNSRNDRQSQA